MKIDIFFNILKTMIPDIAKIIFFLLLYEIVIKITTYNNIIEVYY
jgi:hypothetical protein